MQYRATRIMLALGMLGASACASGRASSAAPSGGEVASAGTSDTASPEPRRVADPPAPVATAEEPKAASAEAERSEPSLASGAAAPAPTTSAPASAPSKREAAKKSAPRSAADESTRGRSAPLGSAAAGEGGKAEGRRVAPAPEPEPAPITAPAMRAGRHDDNKEYNRFLSFLSENRGLVAYPVDISERLVLRTLDADAKSLNDCTVVVQDTQGKALATSQTFADGRTQFFPADASAREAKDYAVQATCGKETRRGQLARAGRRETELRFGFKRSVPARVPVDIAIVLDTTGSMQSQIDRLKTTLKAIHFQLTQLSTRPDIRFALVAYRDRGDDYVTRVTGFTSDVAAFQRVLDRLEADGGGDTPEDMQAALDSAMHELKWRSDALRLGFLVSDVPPHTDYGQEYTYREAMREGLKRAIKWTMVGAGGLDRQGEVVFRQIAQFTMGEYVFVTESGAGDQEGGAGEASHHVGSNYRTENLDQAIVRIVRRELSYLTDQPKDFDDTIVAQAEPGTSRDTVLAPAVVELLRQLQDYSALKLAPATPVAIVPVGVADKRLKPVGEYLTLQLTLNASRSPAFRLVERDLQALAQEVKLQLSDLFDVTETVPIGKMLGAEVLVVTKLVGRDGGAELFAKLIRVETGEILSVARVDIGKGVLAGS